MIKATGKRRGKEEQSYKLSSGLFLGESTLACLITFCR